jgi:hypothetical protein
MRFTFVALAVVFVISSSNAISNQQFASSQGHAALLPILQSASPEKLVLKEGADVNLKFAQDLSSKTATEGDPVNLVLDQDLKLGDVVVAKKGAKAVATVTNAKKAGMMGKAGELNIRLEYMLVGDERLRLRGSKGKQGEGKEGTTVALTVLFGPIGLIKHGKNVEIKEGSPLLVYTDENFTVAAVQPENPAPASGSAPGTAGSALSTNSYEGDFPGLAYTAQQGWIAITAEKLHQGNEARLARVTASVVQQHPGEGSLHVIVPKALFYASPSGGGDGDQISLPSVRIMAVEWSAEPPSLDTVAHDAAEKANQGVTLLNPPTEYKVGGQVFIRADYKDESQKPPQWESHVQTLARGYLLTLEIYAGSAEDLQQAASTMSSFSVAAP